MSPPECPKCHANSYDPEKQSCPYCSGHDWLFGDIVRQIIEQRKARSLVAGYMLEAYKASGIAAFSPPPMALIVKHLRAFEQEVLRKHVRALHLKHPDAKIDGFEEYARSRLRLMYPRKRAGRPREANREMLRGLVGILENWIHRVRAMLLEDAKAVPRSQRPAKLRKEAGAAVATLFGGLLEIAPAAQPLDRKKAIDRIRDVLLTARKTDRGVAIFILSLMSDRPVNTIRQYTARVDKNSA